MEAKIIYTHRAIIRFLGKATQVVGGYNQDLGLVLIENVTKQTFQERFSCIAGPTASYRRVLSGAR